MDSTFATQKASTVDSFIGPDHPRGARCGSSLDWDSCDVCGGDGITGPGELHEEDPLWYDPDDFEPCSQCGGQACWPQCLSSEEWCNANPLEGRETIERNTPEWFVTGRGDSVPSGNTTGAHPLSKTFLSTEVEQSSSEEEEA